MCVLLSKIRSRSVGEQGGLRIPQKKRRRNLWLALIAALAIGAARQRGGERELSGGALRASVHTKACTPIVSEDGSERPRGGNDPNVRQLVSGTSRMQRVHTVEGHAATRRSEAGPHAAAWARAESVAPPESGQTRRARPARFTGFH